MATTAPDLGPARYARQPPLATDICRGAARLLGAHGLATVAELTLANGRRADLAGVSHRGAIWIVEVKSCLEDFRSDQKWPEYRAFCDHLYFAVAPDFPHEVLPPDTGLIVADRHGGEIIRAAPEHRLAGARRKAMTLRFARIAALRLQAATDPDGGLERWAAQLE
jgi:YD repeat-containing protein